MDNHKKDMKLDPKFLFCKSTLNDLEWLLNINSQSYLKHSKYFGRNLNNFEVQKNDILLVGQKWTGMQLMALAINKQRNDSKACVKKKYD